MKGTNATFLKRPRTHKGMTLGAITRHDTTCEGETTARERKHTNPQNGRTISNTPNAQTSARLAKAVVTSRLLPQLPVQVFLRSSRKHWLYWLVTLSPHRAPRETCTQVTPIDGTLSCLTAFQWKVHSLSIHL